MPFAFSMGNKQDELRICVQEQGHNLIAVTERQWDSLHDWNAIIEHYVLFRKNKLGKGGGGIASFLISTRMYRAPPEGG